MTSHTILWIALVMFLVQGIGGLLAPRPYIEFQRQIAERVIGKPPGWVLAGPAPSIRSVAIFCLVIAAALAALIATGN